MERRAAAHIQILILQPHIHKSETLFICIVLHKLKVLLVPDELRELLPIVFKSFGKE
jgi:hypothetical protein